MRRKILMVVAAAVCLISAGCGGPESPAKYRIAVVPKGISHDFWNSIHAGAVCAARERGDTEILWEGPPTEDQRQVQQQIVERFTSERVSALILAPCDRQTLVSPVEGAIKAGIPVVIIDSGLSHTILIRNSDKYLGYVATDNYQGGVDAATRMLEVLKGKERPKVVMIRYQSGSESTEQREAGFRETIKKGKVNFSEAADEAGATVSSAQKVGELLLSDPANSDLDGIFTPNESSTRGVLRALEGLNRAGTVKLVGFDANEILIKALREGKLHGLVLQDPFGMGKESVLRALDYLEGKKPADKIKNTKLRVATKENMDTDDVHELYARDLRPFLAD
jgi:ribose transport system substrate-binding protein